MEQAKDYALQNHAEKVPEEDLNKSCHQTFYLPAESTSGQSLNDVHISGPSLYPKLTTILVCFCLYDIAYSTDISCMFREVSLNPEDRDLHCYLVRGDDRKIED